MIALMSGTRLVSLLHAYIDCIDEASIPDMLLIRLVTSDGYIIGDCLVDDVVDSREGLA